MLHISGKEDLLKDLKEKEGFEGSLLEYAQKFNQGSFYKANSIQYSPLFSGLTQLEKDMLTMDTLQTKLHSLSRQKGSTALRAKQQLQSQIRNLAPQIKQKIYPKIETELSKHMASSYNPFDLKKMTRSSFGEKMARKGKMKTTHLDLASRSGLSRMRSLFLKVSAHLLANPPLVSVGLPLDMIH